MRTGGAEQVVSTGAGWQAWEEPPADWPDKARAAAVRGPACWRGCRTGYLPVDPFSSWFGNVRRDELIAGRILPQMRPYRSQSALTSTAASTGHNRKRKRLFNILTDQDASLAPLEGKTVAVLGYGNQGRARR